jgi:hypothetical protein
MTQKAIKKLIDEEPEYYYTMYREVQPFNDNETFLYERQKNKCRDALIKILKELTK